MAVSLLDSAGPSISAFGVGFLVKSVWDPVREAFGALPAIFGTLLTSAIAMVVGVPISLGVAIFLAELAPKWLRTTASFLVEMLAAMEHARWNAERFLAGWTYGEERDTAGRRSPYLVPWDALPEQIKEYDREAVRNIPALLALIGQKVYR
jgi:hypothetical protein